MTFKIAAMTADAMNHPWLHLLTDQQLEKLETALQKAGMTIEQASVLPPTLVAITIQATSIQNLGFKPESGVDYVLQGELPKERKGYFESVGEQMDLLVGGTHEEGIEALMATIEPIAEMPGMLTSMVDAWQKGEVDEALAEMLSQDIGMTEEYAEVLLYQRNRNWLPVIEDMLAMNEQDLIVVGAAHLAGDGSVIDLLEKAGYTVTRIQ